MDSELDRRTFIKGIGAGVGATAVGAGSMRTQYSPVGNASAVLPLVPIGIAVGGAALGYLINEGVDALLGDDADYSGYTGISALRSDMQAGIVEMKSADERVMTSIENNIESSDNVGLAKGKAALLEAMNAGDGVATAKTKMNDALDQYYTILQKNVMKHFQAQRDQATHHWDQIAAHASGDTANLEIYTENAGTPSWQTGSMGGPAFQQTTVSDNWVFETKSFTYYNGDPESYHIGYYDNTASFDYRFMLSVDPVHIPSHAREVPTRFRFTNIDDGTTSEYMDVARFHAAWTSIGTARDRVNANLQGFADDVYNTYAPGEIPTSELVDPITAYTELNQDYTDTGYYGFQAASAAMLGIKASRGLEMTLYLENSESEVTAQLYTQHQPTDSQGNPIPFRAGSTYDPTAWVEPGYIAYVGLFEDSDGNVVEEKDFVELDQPFTIRSMEDKNGNNIDESDLQSDNYQTYDVAALEAELKQIRESQIAMQEEAEEETSGGGGGGGNSGIVDWAKNNPASAVGGGVGLAVVYKIMTGNA